MEIKILDTNIVKTKSDELKNESNKLQSVEASISNILNELSEYWTATNQDQQSFYQGLQKNVESLETIHTCNNEFADALTNYMEVTEQTGSQNIGG